MMMDSFGNLSSFIWWLDSSFGNLCVEIALHNYVSAKHEGEFELSKRDQEHDLESQNTMQCLPGEEATICPCCSSHLPEM